MRNILLWDFDETLGYRDDRWRGTLFAIAEPVLRERGTIDQYTPDDLLPGIKGGFLWGNPDTGHEELDTPEKWWRWHDPLFARAFGLLGIEGDLAQQLAKQMQQTYLTLEKFHLFDDTLSALASLQEAGWTNYILSNHVPELDQIVTHLGLDAVVEGVFSSGIIGYEKPNPKFFQYALDHIGQYDQVWMIGDNFVADILGSKALRIPGILVRKEHPEAEVQCGDLGEIGTIL